MKLRPRELSRAGVHVVGVFCVLYFVLAGWAWASFHLQGGQRRIDERVRVREAVTRYEETGLNEDRTKAWDTIRYYQDHYAEDPYVNEHLRDLEDLEAGRKEFRPSFRGIADEFRAINDLNAAFKRVMDATVLEEALEEAKVYDIVAQNYADTIARVYPGGVYRHEWVKARQAIDTRADDINQHLLDLGYRYDY